MRDDYENAHHAFFPGKSSSEAQQDWEMFTAAFIPELIAIVLDHLHSLPIPEPDSTAVVRILPERFFHRLVDHIDSSLVHWNLVQRALLYEACATTLWETAVEAWRKICADKNDNQAEALQHSMRNN